MANEASCHQLAGGHGKKPLDVADGRGCENCGRLGRVMVKNGRWKTLSL